MSGKKYLVNKKEISPIESSLNLPSSKKAYLFTSLKVANFIYVIWACFVFASLSYFRPHGKNEFKGLTIDEIALGILYALSSFTMNLPMSYFFSFKMAEDLQKLFSREVFSYNGDWVFGFSAILGVLLGSLTAAAGMAVANLSLQKWVPLWFAYPTTAVFLWNTFTTRSRSTLIMSEEMIGGTRWGFKNIFQITHLQERDWVFQLVKDLKRFKYQVRWLPVDDVPNKSLNEDQKKNSNLSSGN